MNSTTVLYVLDLLATVGVSVWLDVPFDTVLARVPADGRRPLAADRAQLEQLYALRRVAYAQADVRLNAADAAPEDIAARVIEIVR